MCNCDETIISHAQITAARDAVVRTLYNYPNLLLYIENIFKEKNFTLSPMHRRRSLVRVNLWHGSPARFYAGKLRMKFVLLWIETCRFA